MSGAIRRTAVILFACVAGWAQQSQPPTFRSTTTLVELTVVALDNKGDPVPGLKKEELTVRDDGKRRDLSFFRFEGATETTPAPNVLPAGSFSNRPEYVHGPPRNVAAIVLDTLNTPAQDQIWVRAQVMRYLRALAPETRVAIYCLGERMSILHDFTDDLDSLRARLASGGLESQTQMPTDIEREVRDSLNLLEMISPEKRAFVMEAMTAQIEADSLANARIRERRLSISLASLEALGNHLAAIPGRKSVVWISGGISMLSITGGLGIKSYESLVRATSERLANQGITMYLVDKRGLSGTAGISAELGKEPSSEIGRLASGMKKQEQAARVSADPLPAMMLMAEVTGGRVVMNSNDLAKGMKEALADLRGSYSLGFYAAGEPDGRWHKLNVSVKRPGVKLAYRQGYRSEAPAPQPLNWTAEQWNASAYNPLSSTALHLDARCEMRDGILNAVLFIPAEDLHLRRVGKEMVSGLEIALVEKSAAGVLGITQEPVAFRFPAEGENVTRVGRYRKSWKLSAETSAVRLIARDRSTGRFGTLDLPLKQIPLSAPPGGK